MFSEIPGTHEGHSGWDCEKHDVLEGIAKKNKKTMQNVPLNIDNVSVLMKTALIN